MGYPRGDRRSLAIKHYLRTGNGAEAIRRAGFSDSHPETKWFKLKKDPKFAAQLEAAQKAQAERLQIDAETVLGQLASIATSDITDHVGWTSHGDIVCTASDDLTPVQTAAIKQINVDPKTGRITKITLHDKLGALEALARQLGLKAGERDVRIVVVTGLEGQIGGGAAPDTSQQVGES